MSESEFPTPEPGELYRDCDPLAGHVRLYTVDESGERIFEVTVRKDVFTPELIDRWRDDARAIAGPPDPHAQAARRRVLRLI